MFCIAWQYLTGRCVATDFADRERVEWPPHPDRVFQALVATWGERGEDPEERCALEWLESLGHPELVVPEPVPYPDKFRGHVKVYVPVNDVESSQKTYGDPLISLLPERRDRKERYFPWIRVEDEPCALAWSEAEVGTHLAALEKLCAEVIRIGHSSSLVRCWVSDSPPFPVTHVPVEKESQREISLRVSEVGRLQSLVKHRKAIEEKLVGDDLPPRSRQVGYRRVASDLSVPQGEFGSLLILRQVGGRRLGLGQTSAVVQALRGAMIGASEAISADAKKLVSGHAANGAPLRNEPHLAYLPLGFVGNEHADGHLLGLSLGVPKGLPPVHEDLVYRCLGSLLGESFKIRLVLGAMGEVILEHEDRPLPPWALRSETWTKPSSHWASVTPIVLDRMQSSRRSDPDGWAAEQVARMCETQGLPRPEQVVIRPVSFLTGAPSCASMTPLRRKDGSSHRMVHAHLTWSREVAGPLILGAGRFKGYGLCKPFGPWEDSSC